MLHGRLDRTLVVAGAILITNLLANVDVDDLGHGIDFYCRAFGLSVGRRLGKAGVELLGAASPIYLLEKPAGSAVSVATRQRRDYSRHWTPVHLDFVVENIDAAIEKAEAAGAVLEGRFVRTHGVALP